MTKLTKHFFVKTTTNVGPFNVALKVQVIERFWKGNRKSEELLAIASKLYRMNTSDPYSEKNPRFEYTSVESWEEISEKEYNRLNEEG